MSTGGNAVTPQQPDHEVLIVGAGSNTYHVNYQGEPAIRPTTGLDQWWGNRHFPFRHYAFTTRPAPVAARDRQPAIASV